MSRNLSRKKRQLEAAKANGKEETEIRIARRNAERVWNKYLGYRETDSKDAVKNRRETEQLGGRWWLVLPKDTISQKDLGLLDKGFERDRIKDRRQREFARLQRDEIAETYKRVRDSEGQIEIRRTPPDLRDPGLDDIGSESDGLAKLGAGGGFLPVRVISAMAPQTEDRTDVDAHTTQRNTSEGFEAWEKNGIVRIYEPGEELPPDGKRLYGEGSRDELVTGFALEITHLHVGKLTSSSGKKRWQLIGNLPDDRCIRLASGSEEICDREKIRIEGMLPKKMTATELERLSLLPKHLIILANGDTYVTRKVGQQVTIYYLFLVGRDGKRCEEEFIGGFPTNAKTLQKLVELAMGCETSLVEKKSGHEKGATPGRETHDSANARTQTGVLYEIRPIKKKVPSKTLVDGEELELGGTKLAIVGHGIVRTTPNGKEKVIKRFIGEDSEKAARNELCDWISIEDGTEFTDKSGKRYRISKDDRYVEVQLEQWNGTRWEWITIREIEKRIRETIEVQTVETTRLRHLSNTAKEKLDISLTACGVIAVFAILVALLIVKTPNAAKNNDAAPDAAVQQQDAGQRD
ncbi:MAG: hypothetical protein ABII39_03050 [Candidatus Micrarchaeota archaeon]